MSDVASLQFIIKKLFLEKLNIDVASVETDLLETGTLDSMAFVDLLMNIEVEFGVKVSVDNLEVDDFRTIKKIAEFIYGNNSS